MSSNPYPLIAERTPARKGTGQVAPEKPAARLPASVSARAVVDPPSNTAISSIAVDPRPTTVAPNATGSHVARLPRILLVANVLALVLAFIFVQAVSQHDPWNPGWAGLVALIVITLGAKSSGLHDRGEGLLPSATLDEAPKIFQLATLCVLTTWLVTGLLDRRVPHPSQVLELWLALSLLLLATRTVGRLVDARLFPAERCVFIGDEQAEWAFRSKLSNNAEIGTTVVARISLEELYDWRLDDNFVNTVAELRHLAQALRVQRAVVAPAHDDPDGACDLMHLLQAAGVRVSVLPARIDAFGPSIAFNELDGMPIMDLRGLELDRSSALLKRAFDLALTLIALLVASPLMLAIAVAIKLDSRGPVFFCQFRVGRHGLRFQMRKFRTMVRDAESLKDSLSHRNQASTGLFKINEDPRVTRVGRFLRMTSLDELPQLLNVLGGDMSLVGPRPLIPEEDSLVQGRQRRRLELLPGITGPWQILGPVRVSLEEMANIDNRYLLDRSMWTDVTIMLRTLRHIIGRRGL